MQHIVAALCCGMCSGDEILGQSLALQEEKELKENKLVPPIQNGFSILINKKPKKAQ